jgi:diaminopimelate epimerase
MKKINFIKMQSLGNDFVIIDKLKNTYKLNKKIIKNISDRFYGVGCDQVLVLEKSRKKEISFNYKIYNKDGSESGQCGNGAKCVAKYYFDKYEKNKKEIIVETIRNKMKLKKIGSQKIEVEIGIPNFNFSEKISKKDFFVHNGKKYKFESIFIGNPHAVFNMKDIEKINLAEFSENFSKKKFFKNGVNISIIQNIGKNNWKARVFERGSGETNSCGSAACAITVATRKLKINDLAYTSVHMKGGKAQVKWSGSDTDSIYLMGKSEYIFEGIYFIK